VDLHHLIKMANEIGGFFGSLPDHEEAVTSMAQHLKNFWEPRMRREIIAYAQNNGAELLPFAREAIARLDPIRPLI
jgi:formate dehydrogenase subunit delta